MLGISSEKTGQARVARVPVWQPFEACLFD
jgi:hypothetical protein